MNNNLTKKSGRPPPEVSQAACESEKSSWLARKWLASDIRKQFNQYKTENYEY